MLRFNFQIIYKPGVISIRLKVLNRLSEYKLILKGNNKLINMYRPFLILIIFNKKLFSKYLAKWKKLTAAITKLNKSEFSFKKTFYKLNLLKLIDN